VAPLIKIPLYKLRPEKKPHGWWGWRAQDSLFPSPDVFSSKPYCRYEYQYSCEENGQVIGRAYRKVLWTEM
jgi:hypothetical protein